MRRLLTAVGVATVVAVAAWIGVQRLRPDERVAVIPGEHERVLVEVLNASGSDGLARRVTRALRGAGYDVVFYGTAPFDTLAVTRLAVRRGDTLAAGRIREALGVGVVEVAPDPRLLLDVSVWLGRDLAALGREP